ncbi:UNVERIFIED_CONTAM: hypothetical protein FKN15_070953 [Acipenser sinensis]
MDSVKMESVQIKEDFPERELLPCTEESSGLASLPIKQECFERQCDCCLMEVSDINAEHNELEISQTEEPLSVKQEKGLETVCIKQEPLEVEFDHMEPGKEESEDFKPNIPELEPVRLRECSVVLERICVREQGAGEEGSPNSTQGGGKEDGRSHSECSLAVGQTALLSTSEFTQERNRISAVTVGRVSVGQTALLSTSEFTQERNRISAVTVGRVSVGQTALLSTSEFTQERNRISAVTVGRVSVGQTALLSTSEFTQERNRISAVTVGRVSVGQTALLSTSEFTQERNRISAVTVGRVSVGQTALLSTSEFTQERNRISAVTVGRVSVGQTAFRNTNKFTEERNLKDYVQWDFSLTPTPKPRTRLEAWEKFYLPERVEMRVIGAIDNFPSLAVGLQLIILAGRDGNIYAYENEVLHQAAGSLQDLFRKGIEFPGTKVYNYGELFAPMVLHSIFFLGNINDVKIDPMEFFTHKVGEEIKKKFPEAFEKYDTHLPTRTPFSILLDAVVLIKGNQNQKDVMEYLSALLKEMSVPKPNRVTHSNYYTLEATVICMCHYERNGLKGPNPNPNFYGGSLSCKGIKVRKVMIALLCLEPWTPTVAYAMAFADEGAYIKLPKDVISEAFQRDLKTDSYLEKAPCTNCITIFRGVSFKPSCKGKNKKEPWPYGNCAETESLSKLLKADLTLREQVEVHNKTGIVHLDLETHQIHSKATETLVEELPEGSLTASKASQEGDPEDTMFLQVGCSSLCSAVDPDNDHHTQCHLNSQSSSLFEKYSKLQNQQKEMDRTFSALQKNYENVNESGILVDVTLDVDTANPWLILSEDRKEVKDGNTRHDLPDSPKRFDRVVSVLGKQGFTSGRHYWQVEVGEKTQWTLGVAKESINRTGMIIVSPENGYWTVWLRISSGFRALTNTPTPLPLSLKPRKLGVYLDYEEGQVSFYNVETRSHIFTFNDTFTEKIYPFFSPGLFEQKNEAPLIIYPVSD